MLILISLDRNKNTRPVDKRTRGWNEENSSMSIQKGYPPLLSTACNRSSHHSRHLRAPWTPLPITPEPQTNASSLTHSDASSTAHLDVSTPSKTAPSQSPESHHRLTFSISQVDPMCILRKTVPSRSNRVNGMWTNFSHFTLNGNVISLSRQARSCISHNPFSFKRIKETTWISFEFCALTKK